MATTRTLSNGSLLTDWTTEINDIENQYGMINDSGLFSGRGTGQLSMLFDKSSNQTVMLGQTRRNSGPITRGQDRKVETFSLSLPYFLYQDNITPQDMQGLRMAGTPDSEETLANVIATKLEDLRMVADQTREYMKINAMKGKTIDADGNVIADMYSVLGLDDTDYELDFKLGTAGTDVGLKIAELKRRIARGAMTGGAIGKIEVMVSPEFFDALVTHPTIQAAYAQYAVKNANSDVHRGDLQRFEKWGVVDTFEHKGIMFYTYDARFIKDDGDGTVTEVSALGDTSSASRDVVADGATAPAGNKVGYTVVRGVRNLYQGVYGPANTLHGANKAGSEMMVSQYSDPKDKFHELELEMANLYWMSRPQLSYRVFSSN